VQLEFFRVDGQTDLYDVVRDTRTIGIVWRRGAVWHASVESMADTKIAEQTREAAAAKLWGPGVVEAT
jgi:hypothetical protein